MEAVVIAQKCHCTPYWLFLQEISFLSQVKYNGVTCAVSKATWEYNSFVPEGEESVVYEYCSWDTPFLYAVGSFRFVWTSCLRWVKKEETHSFSHIMNILLFFFTPIITPPAVWDPPPCFQVKTRQVFEAQCWLFTCLTSEKEFRYPSLLPPPPPNSESRMEEIWRTLKMENVKCKD